MTAKLEKSIFFIGMPRSGTTILFEAFARHPELGWPSNYSNAYPTCAWMNVFRRLLDNRFLRLYGSKKQYQKQGLLATYLPQPSEAYSFWDRHTESDFSRSWLLGKDCDPCEAERLRRSVKRICWWQGRRRFSAKLTGPPRVRFLHSIFGADTIFVHVIRDPRAVVESLLNVDFWRELGGFEKPFWDNGLSPESIADWERQGRDPGVLAAMQWKRVVEASREESAQVAPGQYIEVSYEGFMRAPHDALTNLYAKCQLDDAVQAHQALDNGPQLRNMNQKYEKKFSSDYIELLNRTSEPLLSELGYA